MSISTTELLIICAFFLILSLLRFRIVPKSANEFEALRSLIRAEIAQFDLEAQQRMTAAFLDSIEDDATPDPTPRTLKSSAGNAHVRSDR